MHLLMQKVSSQVGCRPKMKLFALLLICNALMQAQGATKGRGLNILADDATIRIGAKKEIRFTRAGLSHLKIDAKLVTFSGAVSYTHLTLPTKRIV